MTITVRQFSFWRWRLNRILKKNEKRKKLNKWHIWFAWHPIRITNPSDLNDDTIVFCWLQKVYRKARLYSKYHDGFGVEKITTRDWSYTLNDFKILSES